MKILGYGTFFYCFSNEITIGINFDNMFMKMRFLASYVLVILICNLTMPILQCRSMVMTEFFIINFVFLSYILTYPCIYSTLIHLLYEFAILVIIS